MADLPESKDNISLSHSFSRFVASCISFFNIQFRNNFFSDDQKCNFSNKIINKVISSSALEALAFSFLSYSLLRILDINLLWIFSIAPVFTLGWIIAIILHRSRSTLVGIRILTSYTIPTLALAVNLVMDKLSLPLTTGMFCSWLYCCSISRFMISLYSFPKY